MSIIKVYNVTPDEGCNTCCEKDIEGVMEWIEQAEPGEKVTIEVLMMSEVEYAGLPEYMGP